MRFSRSLKLNHVFRKLYNRGDSAVNRYLVLYCQPNHLQENRVGITVGKKLGKAVVRNRARRVMRAALCEVMPQDVGPYDVVLVARGATPRLKSTQLVPVMRKLLKKAGLIE